MPMRSLNNNPTAQEIFSLTTSFTNIMRNLPFEQLHEISLKEVYQKATAENSDLRKDIRLKTLRHHFGIEQIKKMDLFKSYRIVNDRRMVSTSDERNESGISVLRIQLTIGEWSALVTKETNQEFESGISVLRSQLFCCA